MGQTTDFDVVGSYNNQRVTNIDAERSINLFEYIDPLGKKPKVLINTSGLVNTDINYGTDRGFRAQFVFGNSEYSVVGSRVYRKTLPSLVVTQIGSIGTFEGYVGVDANTFQILFVDGSEGYIYDTITGDFTLITDLAFPTGFCTDCTFLDGFFVVIHGTTNQFQLSQFNQGLVWGNDFTLGPPATGNTFLAAGASSPNLILSSGTTANYQVGTTVQFFLGVGGVFPVSVPPLVEGQTYYVQSVVNANTFTITATHNTSGNVPILFTTTGTPIIYVTNNGELQQGQVNSHPGTLIACRTLHRILFFFCENFTEVWQNAGIGTNLPFRRINAALIEYGTPARGSVAVGFDKMFFLSQDRDGLGAVMEVIGTEALPVSNRALDFQLSQYAALNQVSDCRAFLIKENGLIFYRMNFTAANHTFVYNVTFSSPQNEESKLWHEEETLDGDRHPAQTHAYFNGVNYVGNYALPIEYVLDPNIYTNAGENIRRVRITKAIVPPGYQRMRIDRLQLDLLQGQLVSQSEVLTLLTENGEIILTENGLDLLLQQAQQVILDGPLYVFLSISRDGGQSYGYKYRAPMGQLGARAFRTLWRKLGIIPRGQAFVAQFEFFDNAPFVILGGSWAMEVLPE